MLDLGAAPGAWSQYASKIVGAEGRIIAVDLLPMDPVSGVDVIQGDFRDEKVLDEVLQCVGTDQFDLVMSDMAPNISGMKSVDQPRSDVSGGIGVHDYGFRGLEERRLFRNETISR